MDADRTLILSQSQAEQLFHVCAAYRSYAWQTLPPTPERNHLMRAAQAVQGRLAETRACCAESLLFALTEEERQALRVVMRTLMQVYGAETPAVGRNRLLGELAALRVLFEYTCRQTRVW